MDDSTKKPNILQTFDLEPQGNGSVKAILGFLDEASAPSSFQVIIPAQRIPEIEKAFGDIVRRRRSDQ